MNDTNVLIVGAGPVGLTLAIDLDQEKKVFQDFVIVRYDEPEILPSSIRKICLRCADAGQ